MTLLIMMIFLKVLWKRLGVISLKKLCYCKKNLIKITESRCSECEKKYRESRNLFKKKGANDSFYKLNAWKKLSILVKDNFHGLDAYELAVNGRLVKAKIIHHISPVNENWDRRFDIYNLIPLSLKSHRIIESLYNTDKKEEIQSLLFEIVRKHYEG